MSGKLFIFTGAGLSAESGLATFRDSNGLWNNYSTQEVCNIATWKGNKPAVFDFYNQRRAQMGTVSPNAAHEAIAKLTRALGEDRVFNVTMNVDDLLERAGCPEVLHVHGNIADMLCTACGDTYSVGAAPTSPDDVCPLCGTAGESKPGVVFFGESAPKYQRMYRIFTMPTKDDIIMVIGTSGTVINPDHLLEFSVPSRKILINKEKPQMMVHQYETYYGEAGEILPTLVPDIVEYLNKSS